MNINKRGLTGRVKEKQQYCIEMTQDICFDIF